MADTTHTTKPPSDIPGILAIVEQCRQALRRHRVNLALSGIASLAAGMLLLLALTDVMLPMERWARVLACGAFWSMLLSTAAITAMRLFRRDASPHSVAVRMESALPSMHSRLVTIVDLAGRTAAPDTASPFVRRLIDHTSDRLRSFDPGAILNQKLARRVHVTLGSIAGAWLITLMLFGAQVSTAVARIMRPTADISPRAAVRYQVEPGDVTVLEGNPLDIHVVFESEHRAPLSMRVRPVDGAWFTYPIISNDAGDTIYNLSAVDRAYEYQVVGGGTWSPVYHIDVVKRPVVTSLRMEASLPMYLGQPDNKPLEAEAGRAVVLAGSTVRVMAEVSGKPVIGEVQLLRSHDIVVQQIEERQTTWFDDELPSDATPIGPWRWTGVDTFSGRRAHAFNWQREPYGFATRLAPLTLTREDAFFLYARNDPQNPSRTLAVTLTIDGKERLIAWGAPLREGIEAVHAGRFEAGDGWQKLAVPAAALLRAGIDSAQVTGIRFAIDRGAMTLDRVGTSRKVDTNITRTVLEASMMLPLMYDAAQRRWIGDIPVDENVTFTLQFRTAEQYSSTAMQPVQLVALADQPPSIVIERPATHVTLPAAKPLPLLTRAFDDLGIAAVGLQVGASEEALNKPRWLQQFDDPRSTRMVLSAVPLDESIAPAGTTLVYRTVVRDFRGQLAYSDLHHVTISQPTAPTSEAVTGNNRLSQLVDAVQNLLRESSELVTDIAAAAPTLPDAKNADSRSEPSDTEEGKTDLEARRRELDANINRFAEQLDDAASQAANDPSAMPGEDELFRALKDHVNDTPEADDAAKGSPVDRTASLEHTRQQLSRLQDAHDALMSDPAAAQTTMRNLLADARADQAVRAMERVERQMARHRDDLDAASRQLFQAEASTAPDAEKPRSLSDAAEKEQAERSLTQAKQMLDQQPELNREQGRSSPMPRPSESNLPSEMAAQSQRMEAGRQQLAEVRQALDGALQEFREQQQDTPTGSGSGQSARQLEQATQAPLVQDALRVARSLPMAGDAKVAQQVAGGVVSPQAASASATPLPPPTIAYSEEGDRIEPGRLSPASMYKLPPHLRQPLLDGMRDRVPEGYQPLIDAYYRQLSEGVK